MTTDTNMDKLKSKELKTNRGEGIKEFVGFTKIDRKSPTWLRKSKRNNRFLVYKELKT